MHKLGIEIVAPNTSAINELSESQPYYGMQMNSYPRQSLLPLAVYDELALSTTRWFEYNLGPSRPLAARPAPYAGLSGAALSPPHGT